MKTLLPTLACLLLPLLASAAGGISSGGGNVLFPVDPREPLAPDAVKSLVPHAHADLLAYLSGKKAAWIAGRLSPGESADFAALFTAKADVMKVSSATPVDVEVGQPCYDLSSQAVDGSIRNDEGAGICLSAFTISRRVEGADVRAQSAALLAHEFSELVGFDEDQAVRLQSRVLDAFRSR